MKSYVKRASKLSVSAHNIEFFTFLSQFACYAFPYFSPACCHTVAMRFCTYSPFVATPLQCVSAHIPHLLPHRCNAFLYIFPICCHTVAMRFYTYSPSVATPLQCVSIHIPHLLPHRCNAFLYIFPICCHYFATRFYTYSLFVATTLQHVGSKIVMQKGRKCNTMGTVWFYRNIATNKQNTYYTKTVATLCKCHKYTPETQKRGKQLPFW